MRRAASVKEGSKRTLTASTTKAWHAGHGENLEGAT